MSVAWEAFIRSFGTFLYSHTIPKGGAVVIFYSCVRLPPVRNPQCQEAVENALKFCIDSVVGNAKIGEYLIVLPTQAVHVHTSLNLVIRVRFFVAIVCLEMMFEPCPNGDSGRPTPSCRRNSLSPLFPTTRLDDTCRACVRAIAFMSFKKALARYRMANIVVE